MAECYSSLGSAYCNTCEYLLAIENYRKALDIEEKLLPPLHPTFAYYYSKLAFAFQRNNQQSLAIFHFEMALEIGLKSLPTGHPLVIDLYYVLGTIHKKLGHYKKAKEYFRKQFEILDHLRTSTVSMIDVVGISVSKMHYLCPQCCLPVWVYPACRLFKGRRCVRCLRQALHPCGNVRVTPISADE